MIADIYKQGFGSLSRLISKRSSRDSLPDNHHLIHFQCCNSVILNALAHKTSQNSIYRHLWLSSDLINHPARPQIVDAQLTLIFRMWHGAFFFLFWVGIRPIPHVWLFAFNRHLDYPWCMTKNHWWAVDYHVQDWARSVSLLFLVIKAANLSEKVNGVQKLIFCD
jgi:hypothetical protein